MKLRLALSCLGALCMLASTNAHGDEYIQVAYCDLVKDPARYDGKRVRVSASYRYGFEWQEMYCLSCRGSSKTWLEFPQDPPKEMKKAFKNTPTAQGTLNATFDGVFHAKPGSFGDGGYKFQFALEHLSAVQVISRSGGVPEVLPEAEQRRLCGVSRSKTR